MIRPYKTADKEELLTIFRLNIPQYFHADEEKEYSDYLEKMGETYFVIEKDARIIGGAGYEVRETDKSGRINWIFIDPELQSSGIGKNVVKELIIILKANPGVEILIVRTSQLAYRFFEQLGYHVTEIKKDYWAEGLDLYLMHQQPDNFD
ncbi:MAG: GNAT family N-acetyltransferase [Bacteroidia bacterium]